MTKAGRLLLCLGLVSGTVAGCGSDQGSAEDVAALQPPHQTPEALQPVPKPYVDACWKAAEQTTLPVLYCPPIVPDGRLVIGSAGPFGSGQLDSYVVSAQSLSLPAPYVKKVKRQGRPYPPPGHWVITAWGDPGEALDFIRKTENGRETDTGTAEGVQTRTFTVPAGAYALDAGHVVVYWEWKGAAYTVSVHAHVNEPVARAMARALIEQMARCPEPASSPDSECGLTLPTQTH